MLSGQLAPSSAANFESSQPHKQNLSHHSRPNQQQQQRQLLQQQSPNLEGSSKPLDSFANINYQPSNIYPELQLTVDKSTNQLYENKTGAGSLSFATTGYYTSSTPPPPPPAVPPPPGEQSLHGALSKSTISLPTVATTATGTIPKSGSPIVATATTAVSTGNLVSSVTSVNSAAADASGRSAALERAYVHDVYENCDEPVGPIRPRVAQFLAGLDPGSIVCDVGCGNGRYLTSCNPLICTIGVDRCYRLTKNAREKHAEVAVCDNLELPFRDESFDAVLSLAVVHHFATTERRVGAIRELARILRIGGRVVISVWALEQRHRRFESQDVLIPWQPPKNRNYNYSDDDDDDEYLPPYHAYTEDSTNSSRSAGDGDSSSLSSSSPGESCYSFVRRAIQKLAGGRKHPWFLDSWNSKDTKNDSSLDYEDAKDLPIELRRLEDFEDFPDPPLSAGLKSRSLGSILIPPPRQIVRSRSSVPSLGAQIPEPKPPPTSTAAGHYQGGASCSSALYQSSPSLQQHTQKHANVASSSSIYNSTASLTAIFQHQDSTQSDRSSSAASVASVTPHAGRRPKLVKQKQSLCDEDSQQLPDNPQHANNIGSLSSSGNLTRSMENPSISSSKLNKIDSKIFLRKQSSLNEELMAENRLREKERVRKRIQKQMSLNEAFLCRSVFTKRLQVIREGFTTKLKTSTGNLERATKNGLVKIMQNIKNSQFATKDAPSATDGSTNGTAHHPLCYQHMHQHNPQWSSSNGGSRSNSGSSASGCPGCCNCTTPTSNCTCSSNCNNNTVNGNEDQKPRRHSRESGSDSSKDSSLQSDTSIESEDSFASVIFIPRSELQNQSLQQQCSQNSSNNCSNDANSINTNCKSTSSSHKVPSVPTSPMIMPCPPTPAHSPAATSSSSTLPSSMTITTQSCDSSMLASQTTTKNATGQCLLSSTVNPFTPTLRAANDTISALQGDSNRSASSTTSVLTNRFIFDEDHIQQQLQQQQSSSLSAETKAHSKSQNPAQKLPKITRQSIKDLPPIPKFRKAQSLQQSSKVSFPIVRRLSAAAPIVPKLMSLEIYNPETDDLDSDSSEPSSPDSIDSVISALKPTSASEENSTAQPITQPQLHQQELHKIQQEQLQQQRMQQTPQSEPTGKDAPDESTRQHLVDFAEKLSAQLLKELDESTDQPVDDEDTAALLTDRIKSASSNPFAKNPLDTLDHNMKREDLRERRLMLANLTRSNSPTSHSSSPSSASSLSLKSQSNRTKNSSSSYSEAYDDAVAQSASRRFKFFRGFTNDRQHQQHYSSSMTDTTYLLPRDEEDEDESSYRSNDFDMEGEIEHDVIMEEDEDQEEDDVAQNAISGSGKSDEAVKEKAPDEYDENDTSPHSPCELPLDDRPTTESWGHSNSTNSLDSPSQSGGSTTHHRYYHVFREGELDALINHHVASLHIVSSYYERASWCVVAEKVQVWTI